MGVEETLGVEVEEGREQAPIRLIRFRPDAAYAVSERGRRFVHLHRDTGDDAPGATAASLDRPEEVGVVAGIDHPNLAVGCDDLGLKQIAGG